MTIRSGPNSEGSRLAGNPVERSRSRLHIPNLAAAAEAPGNLGQPLFRIPSLDGWPNGAAKFGARAVPSNLLRLLVDRLGQPNPYGKIQL